MGKILITWTTSWIWNYLAKNLEKDFSVIWVWRSENNIENISFFRWDLKDETFLKDFAQKISEIDFLIINAWVWYFDMFHKITIDEDKEIIETNLISPIILTKLLLPKIKKWIIFIWSISSKKSWSLWASYAASKFWLRWFAMQLKNEVKWIKISIINPKIVKTNFHKNSKIEIVWKYKETSLDEILKVVKKIFSSEEKRFEIDL